MRIPEFRQIVREDFPGVSWIDKLIRPINLALGQIVAGLRNGLTLAENMNAEVRTVDLSGTSFPFKFTTAVRGKVVGLWVGKSSELVGRDEIPSPAGWVSWEQNGQSVTLKSADWFEAGKTYRLTLILVGG